MLLILPQLAVPCQYLAYTELPSTKYQWVHGDAGVIPADGYPLYIILDSQPGNYDPRNNIGEGYSHNYNTVDVWG